MNGDGHGLESQRILDTDWTAGKDKESLIFVGHITGKALEIDAAGLAIAVINMTGFSVIHGMGTAVDTLCSQALGHQAYKRVGIVLQQAIFILGLSVFPVLAMWLNMETLLTLLNQDPCVVRLTAQYVKDILHSTASGFVTNMLNITLHAIFLYGFDLGFEVQLPCSCWPPCGPGDSTSNVGRVELGESGGLVDLHQTGHPWPCSCWASSGGATRLEIIVGGMIGKKELAVYSIVLNVVTFLFMNALSISFANQYTVLGMSWVQANTQHAKRVFYISLVLTGCTRWVFFVGVVDRSSVLFPTLCVSTIIGLPIGVCLALVAEMSAIGFWIGLLCGSTIQAIEKAGRQVSIMFINVGSEDQRTTQGERTAEGHSASLLNKGRRRSGCSKCFRGLSSSKTRLVLYRGSFFLVASIILIAGGIGSHFKLPLAEGNTTNTTSCGEGSMLNNTVLFSFRSP
eukprot:Em0018g203a